jgi:hypothetical protein
MGVAPWSTLEASHHLKRHHPEAGIEQVMQKNYVMQRCACSVVDASQYFPQQIARLLTQEHKHLLQIPVPQG